MLKPSTSIKTAPDGTTTLESPLAPICQSQEILPVGGKLMLPGIIGFCTVTFKLEVLLVVTGSSSVALTLAVFASVPATLEVKTSVTCAFAFAASVPSGQVSVPVAKLHDPWLALLETCVVLAGRVLVSWMLLAGSGPAFVMVMV